LLAELIEETGNFVVALHVTGVNLLTAEFGSHLGDTFLKAFVLVGEGEFGTFPVHGFCDPVGDRAVGQQSGDQNAFAGEKAHVRCLQ
jgi:hypothetical protein